MTHYDGPTVLRYGVNLTRKTLYLVLSGMVSEESVPRAIRGIIRLYESL